jgi:hypothetical protein
MMHSHSRYSELNKKKKEEEEEEGGGGGTEFLWVTSIWFLLSPVTLTRPCKRILEEEKSKPCGFGSAKWVWPSIFPEDDAEASKRHSRALHLLLID